jgi:hypothetical protein
MGEEIRAPFDPSSYAYQEMIGQVPTFIRLGPFRVYAVIGVPSATLGANNDFALRGDGAAGACIYQKRAGAWVATGA